VRCDTSGVAVRERGRIELSRDEARLQSPDLRRKTTPSEFERFLEQAEPDVFNLHRTSTVLEKS
jgi:hypothetical protein